MAEINTDAPAVNPCVVPLLTERSNDLGVHPTTGGDPDPIAIDRQISSNRGDVTATTGCMTMPMMRSSGLGNTCPSTERGHGNKESKASLLQRHIDLLFSSARPYAGHAGKPEK